MKIGTIAFGLLCVAGLGIVIRLAVQGAAKGAPAPDQSQTAADKASEDQWNITLGTAVMLRKAARNPDSFVVEQVLQMGDGANCFTFRAQNGFGGMNRMRAVLSPAENKLLTSDDAGYRELWNKECAGKVGTDQADKANWALKEDAKEHGE